MKQRKTMKLWQMLILAVICLGLLINMFLPLWNINGTKVIDWVIDTADQMVEEDVEFPGLSKSQLKSIVEYEGEDKKELLEKAAEEIDEGIEKWEEKVGINICSLSGIGVITMDVNALMLGDKEYTEEDLEKYEERLEEKELEKLEKVKQQITKSKGAFVVEYFRTVIILLFILLGFFLKWDRRIVSIISAVFGFWTMCSYGIAWWGTSWFILNGIEDKELAEQLEPVIGSLWGTMVGIGIIMGFILGAILMVMGIISCFVGKTVLPNPIPDPFPNPHPFPEPNPFPNLDPFPIPDPIPTPHPTPKPDPVPIPSQPKSGRVKCTQGVAIGQGFKLPEDRKIIVGKSPQNATLVIYDQHVSNIHCSIRYHAETDSYIVKDHSTNGTFVNGVRLGKDVAMEYPAGTVLSLADGTNKITLG